jgi:outer membrane protein assembly factor BamA
VLQATLQAGFLTRTSNNLNVSICDQFFLGGPLSLRGFSTRGVGPHRDGNALGANVSNSCNIDMMNLILITDVYVAGSGFYMDLVCNVCESCLRLICQFHVDLVPVVCKVCDWFN